ncbi:uncharacterized protein LOC111482702 [Cucurbita maxima]|uniref:Uncharacterized protein LOC111482702 n=1 Tax=Cucurbita maxima TaxID=3661 RepID=A0A6J1JAC8_CUCMA|nr:uncharacterized protein LOC111482702 [Cucurbita maxima]
MIQVFVPLFEVSQILFKIPEGFYFESKLETFVKDQDVCRQKQNLEKQERRTVTLCGDRFLAISIKKREKIHVYSHTLSRGDRTTVERELLGCLIMMLQVIQ